MDRFEEAFIQCLREGLYPGPSNINERYRKDGARVNKLNGEKSKKRLALMYEFGIPYLRGRADYSYTFDGGIIDRVVYKTGVPDYPYLTEDDGFATSLKKPIMGSRKTEILKDSDQPWELRLK